MEIENTTLQMINELNLIAKKYGYRFIKDITLSITSGEDIKYTTLQA